MTSHRVVLAAGVLVCGLACQSQNGATPEESEPDKEAAGVASTGPVLDNKIAEAVANAADRSTPSAPAVGKGPPPDGILGQERADAEVNEGAEAKLVLGGQGSEPRILLGGAPSTRPRTGRVELSLRTGASMLPTTELQLQTALPKLTDQVASKALVFDVTSADVAPDQAAQIPEAMAKELRELKGSSFRFKRQEVLVGTPEFELAKGANPELKTLMQGSAAALAEALPALPDKPVGKGAFWMATSRETILGSDVVAYRMVKVTDVKENSASLEVTTKRYLGRGGVGLPGIETAPVRQFQAESSTEMTMHVGQRLPTEGLTQTSVRALVEREGQALPVQVEMRSSFAFPPPATAGTAAD